MCNNVALASTVVYRTNTQAKTAANELKGENGTRHRSRGCIAGKRQQERAQSAEAANEQASAETTTQTAKPLSIKGVQAHSDQPAARRRTSGF